MAANTVPIFVKSGRVEMCAISTANTNRDGSGDMGTAWTAGADGSRIHKITVKASVTTNPGMVRLYIYDGANARLWREVAVSAITVSATVQSFRSIILLQGEEALLLQDGYALKASTHLAEAFNVIAEGGDF